MNAVSVDDDTVVVAMFGAFDIDSLHFETRCLIRRVMQLTGETERDAVHRAMADRYQRLTDTTTLTERRRRLLNLLRPASPTHRIAETSTRSGWLRGIR